MGWAWPELKIFTERSGLELCLWTFRARLWFISLREREMVPTPYLLILGGMSSGCPQAVWPPRVAVFISVWPCASEDKQGALSGKPMFWRPYRCTTPGVADLVVSVSQACFMDLFSACARWDDLQVDGRPCSYYSPPHACLSRCRGAGTSSTQNS